MKQDLLHKSTPLDDWIQLRKVFEEMVPSTYCCYILLLLYTEYYLYLTLKRCGGDIIYMQLEHILQDLTFVPKCEGLLRKKVAAVFIAKALTSKSVLRYSPGASTSNFRKVAIANSTSTAASWPPSTPSAAIMMF